MKESYFKYPRTPHLPWSQGISSDDVIVSDTTQFKNCEVVITRKMDGENSTGKTSDFHARSPDGRHHPSRDWAKAYWMERSWMLPEGMRISCENVYAKHSIAYDNLPGYLLGFGAWTEDLVLMGWDDTVALFKTLDMPMVDILWRGVWNEKIIRNLWTAGDEIHHEGYVVRKTSPIALKDFGTSVAKYVRKNHVQTDKHWMHQMIVPNKLKE